MAAYLGPAAHRLPDLQHRGHGRSLAAAGRAAPQAARRSQLSLATCSTAVLGTMLICANQNYTILQSVAFALGSGLGYVFAVFIVREGRRRLRSKAISSIFQGLPSSMIYIGVLSLAIYALVGHTVVL